MGNNLCTIIFIHQWNIFHQITVFFSRVKSHLSVDIIDSTYVIYIFQVIQELSFKDWSAIWSSVHLITLKLNFLKTFHFILPSLYSMRLL